MTLKRHHVRSRYRATVLATVLVSALWSAETTSTPSEARALEALQGIVHEKGWPPFERRPDDPWWPLRYLAQQLPEPDTEAMAAWHGMAVKPMGRPVPDYAALMNPIFFRNLVEHYDKATQWPDSEVLLSPEERDHLVAAAAAFSAPRALLRRSQGRLFINKMGQIVRLRSDNPAITHQFVSIAHWVQEHHVNEMKWDFTGYVDLLATLALSEIDTETAITDLIIYQNLLHRHGSPIIIGPWSGFEEHYERAMMILALSGRLSQQQLNQWMHRAPPSGPQTTRGLMLEIMHTWLPLIDNTAQEAIYRNSLIPDESLKEWRIPDDHHAIHEETWQLIAITCDLIDWLMLRRQDCAQAYRRNLQILQDERVSILIRFIIVNYFFATHNATINDTHHVLRRMLVAQVLSLDWQPSRQGHAFALISHEREDGSLLITVDPNAPTPPVYQAEFDAFTDAQPSPPAALGEGQRFGYYLSPGSPRRSWALIRPQARK